MKIKQIRIEVFKDCPAPCSHCYQNQSKGSTGQPSAIFRSPFLYKKLFHDFVNNGGDSVSITGGEFLLPDRWTFSKELLRFLVSAGIKEIRLNSILAFATSEMINELAGISIPRLYIQTGIDGRHLHDTLRFNGALIKTLSSILNLNNAGISNISARTTLFFGNRIGQRIYNNLGELPEIIDTCRNHGIKRMKTKLLHFTGRIPGDILEFNQLFESEFSDSISTSLRNLVEHKERENINVKLLLTNPLPENFLSWFNNFFGSLNPSGYEIEKCSCGDRHVAIDGDGNVFRCLYNFGKPGLAIGNIQRDSWQTILKSTSRLSYVNEGTARGTCLSFDSNSGFSRTSDQMQIYRERFL